MQNPYYGQGNFNASFINYGVLDDEARKYCGIHKK